MYFFTPTCDSVCMKAVTIELAFFFFFFFSSSPSSSTPAHALTWAYLCDLSHLLRYSVPQISFFFLFCFVLLLLFSLLFPLLLRAFCATFFFFFFLRGCCFLPYLFICSLCPLSVHGKKKKKKSKIEKRQTNMEPDFLFFFFFWLLFREGEVWLASSKCLTEAFFSSLVISASGKGTQ